MELLRQRRFPFAMIGHCEDNDGISFVDVDFVHAAREALRYLAGLGHRRVAFLGASDQLDGVGTVQPSARKPASSQAIAELGLEGTWHPCDAEPAGGVRRGQELLREIAGGDGVGDRPPRRDRRNDAGRARAWAAHPGRPLGGCHDVAAAGGDLHPVADDDGFPGGRRWAAWEPSC